MQTFAFITLVVILLALTNLVNWVVRILASKNANDTEMLIFVVCALYGLISFFVLKYIIIWGHPLFV